MGHREDLLAGAKKCLVEKGFVRTTARDIVNASGANLASIGYHYGSKDALLTQAYIELAQEWGDAVSPEVAGEGGSLERFHSVWKGVIDRQEESAPMWSASMEVALSRDRMPELRAMLAAAQGEGRRGLAALITGIPEEDLDERDERTLGGLYETLLTGLMMQYLFNPEGALTADELTEGMRRTAEAMAKAAPGAEVQG